MGDLTTLAAAKAWLAVTGTTDDTLLSRLISAVSAAAEARMARTIASASYLETRNGNGKSLLLLAASPITAVASLTVDGVAIAARPAPGSSGFTFDDQFLYLSGYSFSRGRQNVVINYTAGFVTTPLSLEQAVLDIVAFKYREKGRIGESSKILNGETVAYFRDVPPDALRVLDSYARVVTP